MENTPTPYQRNRRAGRISPAPPAPVAPQQPMQATPPVLQKPAPQPHQPYAPYPAQPMQRPAMPPVQQPVQQPVQRPAVQPVQQPAPVPMQPQRPVLQKPMQPQQPGNRQPVALQKRPAPTQWNMPTVQPAARRDRDGDASRYHAAPAGARPQAAIRGRRGELTPQPPVQRERPRQPKEEAAAEKPVAKRKVPGWLSTLLSLSIILVLFLNFIYWGMRATLHEYEKERAAAYAAMLNEYHITEQTPGRLAVTWQPLIEQYAKQYNLNPAFVTAIIRMESSFNTRAVSSVGARGLMQMMPDTAQWVAGKLDEPFDFDNLFKAETSIRYGCWYLNYLSGLFRGDPVLVAAAYHAGQGEVWGWLGDPDVSPTGVTVMIDDIPISNTKTYVGRVTKAYGIYQTLLYPESSPDAVPADGAAAGSIAAPGR